MKRSLILTIIILMCLMAPQFSYAESFSFNDGCITIDLPDDLTVYTKGTDASDIAGISDIPDNYELLVSSDALDYYWYFYYMNGTSSIDFNSMSDEQILQLIESDSSDIETDDIKAEVYNNGSKYLMIDSHNKDTNEYIHYYVTGSGNSIYYFIAPSKETDLTDTQKADFRSAIDSITITIKEAPSELEERRAALIRVLKRFGSGLRLRYTSLQQPGRDDQECTLN